MATSKLQPNKTRMSFDATSLQKGLARLGVDLANIVLPEAMFLAGNALLKDAIYISKMAPKRTGALRGSARTQGAGDLAKPHQVKGRKPVAAGESLSIAAGFNIEYAAKWHEVPAGKHINWTTDRGAPDPGRKYLESKLAMFNRKYMEIMGMRFKQYLLTPKKS